MIMGIWRDLTAYVLLAHLITLSRGSTEGQVVLEEILGKNVSIVVIEDKADGPVDLEKLINVTSLTPGNGNSSVPSNKTEVVDENELVSELEEVLVSAASSGQVIMIAPPANRGNSTNALPGPVILIETPTNKSKSLVKNAPSHKNKNHKAASLNLDQDIAQSQTRQTVGPHDYPDDEDLDTLGDLLAITEYEPQRIDAKKIDGRTTEKTSGKSNSTLQSSNYPRLEDTHYDVPRKRIQPRNHYKISDDSKKLVNEVSSEVPIRAAPSNLRPIQTDRRTTTPNPAEHEVERRKSTTSLDQNPTSSYTEIPRGPTNSEIIIPLTTKPTVTRKLSYSEIARGNNLLGSPSSIDTTSTLVPGLLGSTEAYSRSVHNLTSITNQPRRNLHSARVQTTPVPLPSTYYPFLQQQASSVSAKTSSQPTLISSAVPRASRRIDDYPSPDYVTKSNEELQSLTNQPLGYLTRYNLPSLVPRQTPRTRLHPAASEYRQTETPKETPQEEESDEEHSYEDSSPKRPGTVLPPHDSYENTRLRLSRTRTTSRPPFIDYQKAYQNDNQQTADDYRKAHQRENQRAIPSYQNDNSQPILDYQKGNQRPVPEYQKVNQQLNTEYQNDRRFPIVKTTPAYDSYEEEEEEEEEEEGQSTPKSERHRQSETTTSQARNEIYPRQRNSLVASTTTPAYDSYEDEETEKAKPQSQRFAPTGQQRQRATTNPYVVPRQVYQPYSYPRTPQPVTPTSLLDNPIYQLHGVRTSPNPIAANAIYETLQNYQERRTSTSPTPLQRQTSRYVPYRTSTSQRIVTTTAATDSYEDSEETTSPSPITANTIYNPLQNYEEKRSSTPTTSLQRQNRRYVPYGTTTNQRIVTTTVASDSYEDSEETTSPPITTQRLRNSNYVGHHDVKPHFNVYKHNQPSNVTPLTPTGKPFTDYSYRKPINNQYSLYQTKPVTHLTSHASSNPDRNSDRNYATAEVTTPTTYAENSGSNEDESNDRSYVPAATKLRTLNHPRKLEHRNPGIRTTAAPEYESYEDAVEEDKDSPNGNTKLIESNTANYGNRVRPRVVVEEKRHFLPSYTHAALTTPERSRDVQSNYGGRRRASAHVEEQPAEAVHRADVEAAPYEDEVPAGSGHAEDQATHQTHAKAKKHGGGGGGGGGGDHKHEEGGGMKHDEDHHESHGEKGDKGYKGYHEYDKGNKGHHDKEDHDKEYDEKKGEKKKHHDEGGYHKEHHHGEKGDKEAEFAEKGEHQKGHSTKGQHVVHKKDEYEKKTEFYDESHEEDGDEKEGEYHHEHEHKKGGHEKKGHHDSAHHEDKYGEKGEHEKGHHYHEKKGHDGKGGKDQHHHHHEKYGKKGGHEEGLKWSHKKGDDGHGKKKGS